MPFYSLATPVLVMMSRHFTTSVEMKARNSSGLDDVGSAPMSVSRLRRSASCKAATVARLSFSTIECGVPRGASRANHAELS